MSLSAQNIAHASRHTTIEVPKNQEEKVSRLTILDTGRYGYQRHEEAQATIDTDQDLVVHAAL